MKADLPKPYRFHCPRCGKTHQTMSECAVPGYGPISSMDPVKKRKKRAVEPTDEP